MSSNGLLQGDQMYSDESATNTRNTKNSGIDLTTALHILSQRFKPVNLNSPPNNLPASSGCACCEVNRDDPSSSHAISSQIQGQCIDIGEESLDISPSEIISTDDEMSSKHMEQQEAQQLALRRQKELEATIQSMSMKEIVAAVFHTQEGRVRSYYFYDEYVFVNVIVPDF
jgi:hypothetical protein